MTGHSINEEQNQEFLSTMHTMIDDLDTISSAIDEHTYLRLANGLQRLYNLHNSTIQTSTTNNRETLPQRQRERYRENFQDNNEVQITRNLALAQHYGRIYDISGIPVNAHAYPVNAHAYPVNAIINPTVANTNVYDNANYDSWNENNPTPSTRESLRESARISYTALYANANDYWNEARFRQFQENIRTP